MTYFWDNSTAGNASFTNNGRTFANANDGTTVFENSSTAANASFTNNGGTVSGGYGGNTVFYNTSSASNATFTMGGGTVNGAHGGQLGFNDNSTASNATITINGGSGSGALGGYAAWSNTSSAGNATVTANGGSNGGLGGGIYFQDQSDGELASVTANGNGFLDISPQTTGGVNIGSIAGSGNFFLGNKTLTVGGNNQSTNVSGMIQDGGVNNVSGGALVKTGTGTLTLSGANTYTGATTVNQGTLQFAKVNSLYGGAGASWTAAKITTGSGATFAINVGGTGEFTTGNVTTLLGNLSSVSNNGLQAGSAIGFDTSNAAGGTFTISNNIANSTGAGGGAVGLTKLGGNTLVLSGNNNYTGATTVNGGALSVNGSITSASTVNNGGKLNGSGTTGNVTVNSGGTLGGTLASKAVTINSGGTLSPGNSPGADSATSLAVNAGGTFKAEIAVPGSGHYAGAHPAAGIEYDQTTLTGVTNGFAETVLTLNSTAGTGSILWLAISGTLPVGGVASTTNHPYDPLGTNSLLDNYFILNLTDTVDTISGRFAEATLDGVTFTAIDYSSSNRFGGINGVGTFVLSGQEWAISNKGDAATNSTTGGNDLVVDAVPEPSTWAMLAVGAGALFVFRRRKSKAALPKSSGLVPGTDENFVGWF